MKNTPLYKILLDYKARKASSFHMPGHKNCDVNALWNLDYTDTLPQLAESLAAAENYATSYFGTNATFFSAGGNTLCIQAMIKLAVPSKGKIICGRNIHCSAVNTIALLDLTPVWVYPRNNITEPEFSGRVAPDDIEAALCENNDAKAVYITSPDYYGIISDVGSIAKLCKKYAVPLLVDNAHGAHFFCENPSMHPINLGASICADSAHKTLPVLSGGAWLHINDKIYTKNAKKAMAIFGSTSPSLPILASLDICRDWMQNKGVEAFGLLKEKVAAVKLRAKNKGFILPEGPCDTFRITLGGSSLGWLGAELLEFFRKFNIEPEFACNSYVVLIPSPMNNDLDFERLETAISSVPKKNRKCEKISVWERVKRKQYTSIREAMFSSSELVQLSDLEGKVAAEMGCPYPPGLPILMPGEKIERDCLELLENYGVVALKVVLNIT
jgi:arginine/lysine/ornithine decarboxylase